MTSNSSALRKEIENFRASTGKISEKLNNVGDMWTDQNYASLSTQIQELAKHSKIIIESGDKSCTSIDKFFSIAGEDVR